MNGEILRWIGLGLTCGLFLGAAIGILIVGMCVAASKNPKIPIKKSWAIRQHEIKFGTPEHPVDYPTIASLKRNNTRKD